jgi:hypothetical protein
MASVRLPCGILPSASGLLDLSEVVPHCSTAATYRFLAEAPGSTPSAARVRHGLRSFGCLSKSTPDVQVNTPGVRNAYVRSGRGTVRNRDSTPDPWNRPAPTSLTYPQHSRNRCNLGHNRPGFSLALTIHNTLYPHYTLGGVAKGPHPRIDILGSAEPKGHFGFSVADPPNCTTFPP